jgi:mannose-1-phosphate guanylyltransferase
MCLQAVDPEAVMLAMSADHVIRPRDRYQADVARAVQLVQEDPRRLVLFGARPSRPATGYGYIELGESLGTGAACVAAFKEKPDAETAAGYLQSGNYLWNCGIFVWRADRLLELLRQHEPEIAAGLDELRLHLGKTSWNAALAEIFPRLKSISIDYAVLEREQNVAVVNGTFDWDDVGSWEALTRLLPADDKGNAARGSFVGLETKNCIIHASADRLIATIGIEDCIVVQTPTATLVARRQDDAAIRKLLTLIEEQGLERYL